MRGSGSPHRDSNEGKVCDAVIRRIEAREGHLRSELRFPERENHTAPVELTCRIGSHLFALEHTRIEPFERHFELEAKARRHFKPIQDRVAGLLPASEHFELQVPAKATLDLNRRDLKQVQDVIVDWVVATAPTLPVAPPGRYVTPIRYITLPSVPFEVHLARKSRGGCLGQISIKHIYSEADFEKDRAERIQRAYRDKSAKLAAWRKLGARSILIFEESDIQLTNVQSVADAVDEVEKTATEKPDEIYLVSSAIDESWERLIP